jgi:Ca2+/Na+ antiporter
MEQQTIFDWNIPFSLGVIIISLINIALINLHRNQLLYDWYILGVFVFVLIIFSIISIKRKRKEARHFSKT